MIIQIYEYIRIKKMKYYKQIATILNMQLKMNNKRYYNSFDEK